MIYLFCGSDGEKTREKAFEWVTAARKKEPNLSYARLAKEEITESALEDAALSGGLFVRRLLVLIDDPYATMKGFVNPSSDEGFTKPEHDEEPNASILDEHLGRLADSDNAIVILAPKLASSKAKKIAAKAKAAYQYDRRLPPTQSRGFNAALVNALAARSREKLWLELARALRAGDPPEMLHGLLHWKARDLMERSARNWPPREARALSLSLISLLQDSRRKNLDLAESLERFALSL